MKISHITIENFRTFERFDEDLGRHNVIAGKNNTGKSNLLFAIHSFYNPKNLSQDDIRKDEKGNFVAKEFRIILVFDNLTDEEQKNNKKYFQNGKVKISLKGWINENGKFNLEHHGYIQAEKLIFPTDFNENLKTLLEERKSPKKADLLSFEGMSSILQEIKPSGRITNDDWDKIREIYVSKDASIRTELHEEESPEQYQGFIGARKANTTGECILVPAVKDPSDILQTGRKSSPVNQLIQFHLQGVVSEETQGIFDEFRQQIASERKEQVLTLEERFKEELQIWNTTAQINLKSFQISDAIPADFEVLFDDGTLTDLERKGTGLQRYIFFKFLKISHELRLGNMTSLILLFEEPEAHLHPQIQREIAGILKQLASAENMNYQTFISTHSPQFIDIRSLDEILLFNKPSGGCTESNRCGINLTDLKEQIKTILFFNPHVAEIFFAEKIVLIEGQSEEIVINHLVQNGKLDISNASIVNAKSKDNIPTFLEVFNALRIPYSILVDEDPFFLPFFTKQNPDAVKEKKKAYKKTKKIGEKTDETIGRLVVVSPDFDQFLGISKSQMKKHGKPTAAFRWMEDQTDPQKLNEVETLFKLLLNVEGLEHKISNIDGSEWKEKDESLVQIPTPDFASLKDRLKQVRRTHNKPISKLSSSQKQELQDIIAN